MSASDHENISEPRRPEWKRTPAERKAADFKRFLLRNRLVLQSAAIGLVIGIIGAAITLGLPGWIASGFEFAKEELGSAAGLKVKLITVSGLKHLTQQDVEDVLAIRPGASLLDVDAQAMRARVLSLGWAKDVTILRVPPNRLHIAITEYEPSILWQAGRKSYALDAGGHLIAPVNPAVYGALFHVTGNGAAEAAPSLIAWLNARPEVMKHVISAERVSDLRWNLHFGNQQVVELPDHDLDAALAVLARMITKDSLLRRDVVVVDLRDPQKPRLRLGDDALRALRAPHENS
ncbi:MAG TPA: FtsQ-type POTRA domain-containing protein [Alphaproteobacteria bacterium]|nr:FtsQ-type POTRA domain-containing protein [Alphaproteobacteria bacterium]